jgi:hypothetical protein
MRWWAILEQQPDHPSRALGGRLFIHHPAYPFVAAGGPVAIEDRFITR